MLNTTMPGYAAADLGLGDMLRGQLDDETEEQKRKRLELKQAQAAMSPAAQQLFGQRSDAFAF